MQRLTISIVLLQVLFCTIQAQEVYISREQSDKFIFLEPRIIEVLFTSRESSNFLLPTPKPNVVPSPPQLKQLPKADTYTFKVYAKSRDQISNINALCESQKTWVVALDFNRYFRKTSPMVILRNNPSPEMVAAARRYLDLIEEHYGIKRFYGRGRYGAGIKTRSEHGAGWRTPSRKGGVTHVEGFDARDTSMFSKFRNTQELYAKILADSFGKVPGMIFIAPHTISSPGASSPYGHERTFALNYTIPQLQKLQ